MKKILLAVSLLASLLASVVHAEVPVGFETGIYVKKCGEETVCVKPNETYALMNTLGYAFDENDVFIENYPVSLLVWNCGGDSCLEVTPYANPMKWFNGPNNKDLILGEMVPFNFFPLISKNVGGSTSLSVAIAPKNKAVVSIGYTGGSLAGTADASLKANFFYCGDDTAYLPLPSEVYATCHDFEEESAASPAFSRVAEMYVGKAYWIKGKNGKKIKIRLPNLPKLN